MYISFRSVGGLYRFIFPLNFQQSANFFSFFSFLVSNASFDRRAVKSSFRKICAFRCCVLCLLNRARYSLFIIRSVRNLTMLGRLPVRFPPKQWILSTSCSDRGGVTPIILLNTAITLASQVSNLKWLYSKQPKLGLTQEFVVDCAHALWVVHSTKGLVYLMLLKGFYLIVLFILYIGC